MRYLRIFLFIIVIAGGLSGCEKKRISEKYRAEAEQDIFQLQSQYSQAINTKDLNKLTFLYADNGALYDEHNPIIRGKNAVREAWKIDFARPGLTLETFPGGVEIEDGGNLAWGHGTFRMTTDSRAKYWADRWRYALVYTRQPDGKWKIMADSAHSGLRNRLLQTPPQRQVA